MTTLPLQPNTLTMATTVLAAPIIFVYLVGSIPLLVPILLYHWINRRVTPIALEPRVPGMIPAA